MSLNLAPLQIRPGLITDDTAFAVREGGYSDVDKVRFWLDRLQTIGGWEALSNTSLTGICRGIHSWRNNRGEQLFAFGTHQGVFVYEGGAIYDITPTEFVAGLEDGLGGHGYGIGGYGSGPYGTPGTVGDDAIYPLTWTFGNYDQKLIMCPRGQQIFEWDNDTSALATPLAAPVSVYDADFTSYANQTAFDVDYTRGTGWTFDATDDEAECDGTQTSASNLTYSVTGLTVGEIYRVSITFTRTAGSIAALQGSTVGTTSTADSGTVTVQFIATSTSQTIGAQGDADFVGTVTDVAVDQMRAPVNVNAVRVKHRHVIAYGCNEQVSGDWNPSCIRWSDVEGLTDWTTGTGDNAGEDFVTGEALATVDLGQIMLVLTDNQAFYQQYIGDIGRTYAFEAVGDNCGVIGPNAAAVLNNIAFWLGTDGQFRTYAIGASVQTIPAPVSRTLKANIAGAQEGKVYAATISKFNEILWFYPHKDDGLENSRYLSVNASGQWAAGKLARTAFHDAGPYDYPIGVNASGKVFNHELGNSANGDSLSWSATTGDIVIAESGRMVLIDRVRPDIEDQVGAVTLSMSSKVRAQGETMQTETMNFSVGEDEAWPGVTGSIIQLEWSGSGQTFARLGESVFDIKARGTY